jgi:hypothetical protein
VSNVYYFYYWCLVCTRTSHKMCLSYSTVGCCRSEKVTPSWLDMDGALLHIWRVDDRTLINATYNFYNICNVPSNLMKLEMKWLTPPKNNLISLFLWDLNFFYPKTELIPRQIQPGAKINNTSTVVFCV